MAIPHLYRKFQQLARELAEKNQSYELAREEVRREICQKFRLSNSDFSKIVKEMENERRIQRVNKRKIRLL